MDKFCVCYRYITTCVGRNLMHYRNNGIVLYAFWPQNIIIGIFFILRFYPSPVYSFFGNNDMSAVSAYYISLTSGGTMLCGDTKHGIDSITFIQKKLGYNLVVQRFFMDAENHRSRQVNYIAKLHPIGKTHDFSSYMFSIMCLLIRFSHVLM